MQPKITMSKASSPSGCGQLGILPFELRVEIYRYLVGKYTKEELNMKSKEYNWERDGILGGPDHVYHFHPAIFGTNHQIRQEALDIFLREHVPVYLSTGGWLSKSQFFSCSILASGDRALHFPQVAMTLDIDETDENRECQLECHDERTHVVFAVDDFPAVGAFLLRKIASLWCPVLRVHIDENLSADPTGHRRILRKLLDTLQKLRGLDYAEITGPMALAQRDHIIAVMCGDRLSTQDVIRQVSVHLDVAGEASNRGDYTSAIRDHKAALYVLQGSYFDKHERYEIVSGGLFDGYSVSSAREDATIQLHTLIAQAYLALGKHRMARIYVERIYGPLHTYDDLHNQQKFPLEIHTGIPSAYGRLLTVAAQISYTNGHYDVAVCELEEAQRLDPDDLDIQQLLRRARGQFNERRTRRLQFVRREEGIREGKIEATIQIALSRKTLADTYFSTHSFRKALPKYTTALQKLTPLSPVDLYSHSATDLPLKIRARLALTSLKLHDYPSVHHYANNLIASLPDFWHNLNHPYRSCYGVAEMYTAYWAKGTACEEEGKIDGAVRSLELALRCDDGCEESLARLVALREVQAEEGVRLEKVRGEEMRWERRREKRVRKKERERERRWVKRARGLGYVVGGGGRW